MGTVLQSTAGWNCQVFHVTTDEGGLSRLKDFINSHYSAEVLLEMHEHMLTVILSHLQALVNLCHFKLLSRLNPNFIEQIPVPFHVKSCSLILYTLLFIPCQKKRKPFSKPPLQQQSRSVIFSGCPTAYLSHFPVSVISFFKFGTGIHLYSRINWLNYIGQKPLSCMSHSCEQQYLVVHF